MLVSTNLVILCMEFRSAHNRNSLEEHHNTLLQACARTDTVCMQHTHTHTVEAIAHLITSEFVCRFEANSMDTELSEWLDGHDSPQPDTVSHALLSTDTGTSSQIPSSLQTPQGDLASGDAQPAHTLSPSTPPPTAPIDGTPGAAGAVSHKRRRRLPGDQGRGIERACAPARVTEQHAAAPPAVSTQPHGSASHAMATARGTYSCRGSGGSDCSCIVGGAGCGHPSVCSSSDTPPERGSARRPVCVDVSSLGSLGLMPDPGFLLRAVHGALRIIGR